MYLRSSVETSYYSPFVSEWDCEITTVSAWVVGAGLAVCQLEGIKSAPEGTRWCGYIQKASMSWFSPQAKLTPPQPCPGQVKREVPI
ncbi:hypothetical protein CFAM422_011420 [Trichoderma lentiforme]|uniref:Uncharacterized protein n=1 Tax=Trichoderma lentiforme TaxID=1567552 RepID=A0A9P4X5W1_9HYPO|nr:hypothetical protein CFAM422_011420 [Trichoderma lentiforme]